jgi:peptidoglycan hydrolase-like protein with peptidoglycan-binding domain
MRAQWISRTRRGVGAACFAFLFATVVTASDRAKVPEGTAIELQTSSSLDSGTGQQGGTYSTTFARSITIATNGQQDQYPSGRSNRTDYTSPRMVKRAQTELYNRNFYNGLIDGQLNPQTRQALANFQRQNGLPATGDLDQRTASLLGLARSDRGSDSTDRQLAATIFRKAQSLLSNYQSSLGIQVNDISAGLTSNGILNEGDLDLLLQTNSFSNAAAWYQQATANSPYAEGSRIAARILQSSAQRVETSLQNAQQNSKFRQEWASIQSDLSRISVSDSTNEISGSATDYDSGQASGPGHFQWQGIVDGSDNIRLHGSYVDMAHLTAGQVQQATYQLSSALPLRPIQVTLRKVRGRGQIRLLEQPAASNNYTAVVQVDDQDSSGSAWYEFTLDW